MSAAPRSTRPTMRVPLVDLAAQHASLRDELLAAAIEVVDTQAFILGEPVAAFERALAAFSGVKHAVGVASCTDAIELSLRALGIGRGDAVITTPFTFVATAEAIAATGARPIFADIDPVTLNLDATSVEERLARHAGCGAALRAIVPVHLYGRAADMTALGAIARRHGLAVVEDAAQAIGATFDGRAVGALGDAGCFSFFPSKNLGGWGDGGAVVTDDDALAAKIRSARQHGVGERGVHQSLGRNSRLDALQAAVLQVKLRHLPRFVEARARVAATYRAALAGLEEHLSLPPSPGAGSRDGNNLFVVRARLRDELARHLAERGVESRVYYPMPLSSQPCFAAFEPDACPHADAASREVLALPMFAELGGDAIAYVAEALRDFYR